MALTEKSEEVEVIEEAIDADQELETNDGIIDGEKGEEGEKAELEEWEKTGEEEEELPAVPAKTHIKKTLKLKGRIKDRDSENETLKERIKALEAGTVQSNTQRDDKRPEEDDFDTHAEFKDAEEAYLLRVLDRKRNTEKSNKKADEIINKRFEAVDAHTERAETLVTESNIKPEVYEAADATVRSVVNESIKPVKSKLGTIEATDMFIEALGEGSEKVMYYLGRNKAALAEFESIVKSDKHSGIKIAAYLGTLKQKLLGVNTNKRSKAPKPAATATGNKNLVTGAASEKALKKKYDEATKKGDAGLAFKLYRAAKKEHKIDTSKW